MKSFSKCPLFKIAIGQSGTYHNKTDEADFCRSKRSYEIYTVNKTKISEKGGRSRRQSFKHKISFANLRSVSKQLLFYCTG